MEIWALGRDSGGAPVVRLYKRPWWAEVVETGGDRVCALTGHRIERWYGRAVAAVSKRDELLLTVPVTVEQADAMGLHEVE